jgi:hypothetical protein
MNILVCHMIHQVIKFIANLVKFYDVRREVWFIIEEVKIIVDREIKGGQ